MRQNRAKLARITTSTCQFQIEYKICFATATTSITSPPHYNTHNYNRHKNLLCIRPGRYVPRYILLCGCMNMTSLPRGDVVKTRVKTALFIPANRGIVGGTVDIVFYPLMIPQSYVL